MITLWLVGVWVLVGAGIYLALWEEAPDGTSTAAYVLMAIACLVMWPMIVAYLVVNKLMD